MMSTLGSTTTAEEAAKEFAAQIRGKIVLITGVSPNGLGAKFVEVIAAHEPKLLILAARDLSKAQQTSDAIHNVSSKVETRLLKLDLASLKQVRQAAEEVNAYSESIDLLVNNAAVMASPYWETEDGIEGQFGTNHIGPFLFTNLILKKVLASGNGRIVNVASDGHRLSPIRFDDVSFQQGKSYNKWRAYGQAKTANMLFSVALAKRLGPKGLTAVSLHPGQIMTELGRHMEEDDVKSLQALDQELGNKEGNQEGFNLKSLTAGTATHVVAAFEPSLSGKNGAYLQNCQLAPAEDTKPYAVDPELADRLWAMSEGIVGQEFLF